MWFEIFCAVGLLLIGFATLFVGGAIGIAIVIEYFAIAPIFSIISFFGVIGIVTVGILLISGAGRKAREIKEEYID